MYCRLVKAGLRTIQKVPDQFRDDVMTNLTVVTLDGNVKSIPTNISNIIVDR
nr:CD1375 family protein [Clostridium frigoris]